MAKTAFIFPGQGAQYVGMGRELAENYPVAAAVFQEASAALGFDLERLCYEGPAADLEKTENTQPAILTVSVAVLRVAEQLGLSAGVVAGLSLGEYSALVAADALSFTAAVPLVRQRGRFMQGAVPLGKGKMAAILGLEREAVLELCRQCLTLGIVEPANFNCPGQIVIAGEAGAIEQAVELAKAAGAKRALLLSVSAPFHCSLLQPAGVQLAGELEAVTIAAPRIPLIANVSADYVRTGAAIREALIRQVSSPVLWEDTVRRMIADGVDTFIELGPGKVLSGFVRKIAKEANTYNIEDLASLEKVLASRKEVC